MNATTDVHHTHGKIGALFFYFPWFKAVCRECHNWIESNKETARGLGLECTHGAFNTQSASSVWRIKWRGTISYVADVNEESMKAKFETGALESFKLIE